MAKVHAESHLTEKPSRPTAPSLQLKQVLRCESNGLKSEFFHYLETQQAEESLLFWDSVEGYKAAADKKYAKSCPEVCSIPRCSLATISQLEEYIFKTFIFDDASKQINVATPIRNELLQKKGSLDPNLFDKAQRDVEKDLEMDTFPRFLENLASRNLNDRTASFRRNSSAIAFVITFTIVTALIFAGYTTRWLRFPAIPILWQVAAGWVSGRAKV